jgi:predicted transport protein
VLTIVPVEEFTNCEINQGLFYLNWLMSHRKDFEWLVLDRLGMDEVKNIDWSGPRLVCIAGDFTRYDEHAVQQMNRNIDLIRYKKFGDELLLLEQLTSTTSTSSGSAATSMPAPGGGQWVKGKYKTVSDHMEKASPELRDLYESLKAYLTAQGDDVAAKTTEYYIAFRRMKNYVTVEFRTQANKLLVYAKVNPSTVHLELGFARDVTKIAISAVAIWKSRLLRLRILSVPSLCWIGRTTRPRQWAVTK